METTVGALKGQVASRFERLGLPTWPDPHPDLARPGEEEYSRVTDPGRYGTVHVRARVWVEVLEAALGAKSVALTPDGHPFARGVRITPPTAGALPLLLLERDVPTGPGEVPLPVLAIAVARPDVVIETQPDCGCDACDSGSDQLIEAIDAAIGQVVGGPFVALRGKRWSACWHPDGNSANSQGRAPDFAAVMDWCRRLAEGEAVRLPRRTEAFVGGSWLG
jgi:hypothetical protein